MIMFKKKSYSGFTLIELMVVVTIIGAIIGVIIAGINEARNKAKISAITSSMKEFQKLLELEFSETGSYRNLQYSGASPFSAWMPNTPCDSSFAGNNALKAREVCKVIVSNSSASIWGEGWKFYSGNGVDLDGKYSMMASLPNGQFLCIGSSGTSDKTPSQTAYWVGTGCYSNP